MTDILVIACGIISVIAMLAVIGTRSSIKAHNEAVMAQRGPRSESGDSYALGKGRCPACTSPALLSGPSGGMSINVACNSCLMEYNVHHSFGGGILRVDRTGPMTEERAKTFGIDAAEYEAIKRRGL